MSVSDLYNGVAVIIDDEIGEEKANINILIEQIKSKNIPTVLSKKILSKESIVHLGSISFLLLDWELRIAPIGIEGGGGERMNIVFLKEFCQRCFVPIFIFTNEAIEPIKRTLIDNELYLEGKPNCIFIKKKEELIDGNLFGEIESWLKENPSVYVLKEWEKEYNTAKNRLFREFFEFSPFWPNILYSTFSEDKVNPSHSLGDIISKNLRARMLPINFHVDTDASKDVPPSELKRVLEGERFIKNTGLIRDSIAPGDVFKYPGGKYYLNIRPECDCVPDRNKPSATLDAVDLYLLEGEKLTEPNTKKRYSLDRGQFTEYDSDAIVFSMYDGKSYIFQFKDIIIKKWSELKEKERLGRLLPPYITRIQQRYSLYLQRQGLPRIPKEAVLSTEELKAGEGKNGKEVAK